MRKAMILSDGQVLIVENVGSIEIPGLSVIEEIPLIGLSNTEFYEMVANSRDYEPVTINGVRTLGRKVIVS